MRIQRIENAACVIHAACHVTEIPKGVGFAITVCIGCFISWKILYLTRHDLIGLAVLSPLVISKIFFPIQFASQAICRVRIICIKGHILGNSWCGRTARTFGPPPAAGWLGKG